MWVFDIDIWREVFNTLTKNLLRTILTTLGVLFAVMILILLLGASNGMQNGFEKIFKGTSTNSLFVWGGSTGKPYKGFKRGRKISFVTDDVALLKKEVKEIDYIVPRISEYTTVSYKGQKSMITVYGDYPEVDNVSKTNLFEGRFISHNDIKNNRKVCVLGNEAYQRLFGKRDKAIGEYLNVLGVYFKVVGIYKVKQGFENSNSIIVPFTTFKNAFNTGEKVGYMSMTINPNYSVKEVFKKIKSILKLRYKISPNDKRAIGYFDLSKTYGSITSFTMVLKGFSFFIGIFTLLAGVIAISNILLITVKERTKEIGIRRALGATPKVIKRQILLEGIVLTVLSALIGFVISIGILAIVDSKISGSDIPFYNPTVSFTQLISSFILMLTLSMLIGLIPARRAIRIKPIEALRN